MTEPNIEAAIQNARKEGALDATRRARKWALAVAVSLVVVLVATLGFAWTLAARAQDAAPEVIEEIAKERQAQIELRIGERTAEAQRLVAQTFGFLQKVWEQNEALAAVRANLDAATTQMRLLTGEVNAAFDSPTQNLGALLENGPTRASAVLDHAVAIARELTRLIPIVFGALSEAKAAADRASDGATLPAILAAMDGLLEPFIGSNGELQKDWGALKGGLLGWSSHVWRDLDEARAQMSGDVLSDEFMRRLRLRVF